MSRLNYDSLSNTPHKACLNDDGCSGVGIILAGVSPLTFTSHIKCKGTGFLNTKDSRGEDR